MKVDKIWCLNSKSKELISAWRAIWTACHRPVKGRVNLLWVIKQCSMILSVWLKIIKRNYNIIIHTHYIIISSMVYHLSLQDTPFTNDQLSALQKSIIKQMSCPQAWQVHRPVLVQCLPAYSSPWWQVCHWHPQHDVNSLDEWQHLDVCESPHWSCNNMTQSWMLISVMASDGSEL